MLIVKASSTFHHPTGRTWRPMLASLLLVLFVSLVRVAPAGASASAPPKLLYLATLVMYIPEDSSEDKPYLLVGGRKVWRGVMSKPSLCGGGCPVRADLYHIGPIPFYDNIEVVLKEEDWPDPDDFLGRNYISAAETEGVLHEVWFTEDGARYKLTYALSTAAASFVCDGEPGVYLYEHANYRGRCSKFVQNISNLGWYEIGNDAASSIRLVGGYGATLYEHANYGGAVSIYAADQAYLGNDAIGNDRASSLTVFGPGR